MFALNSAELSEIAKELEYNLQNKIIPPAYQQTLAILTDCQELKTQLSVTRGKYMEIMDNYCLYDVVISADKLTQVPELDAVIKATQELQEAQNQIKNMVCQFIPKVISLQAAGLYQNKIHKTAFVL